MTREETIAELKRARSKWAYVLYDDLTNAIGDAIEILEKTEWDKAIDAVLEIIDKATSDYEAMPTEIDVGREKAVISFEKKDGMLAMASMIRVLVLGLRGKE